jgi:hypothetical protein
MTAAVVSLESHRRNRPPACGCSRHLLEALVQRVSAIHAETRDELLVSPAVLDGLTRDVRETVTAALAYSERTTTR